MTELTADLSEEVFTLRQIGFAPAALAGKAADHPKIPPPLQMPIYCIISRFDPTGEAC